MAPRVRADRAGVSLLEAGYAPRTVTRYRRAVLRLLDFAESDNKFLDDNWEVFDSSVARYLQRLFAEGGSKSLASDTLNGLVMYLPHAKGKLLMSLRLVRNWGRFEPSVPYPPLPYDACLAIALTFAADRRQDYALATLLAFDCFLRIGEFTSLLREDVAVTGPAREAGGVVLRLGRTKTGPNQSVVVDDADVATLMAAHLKTVRPYSHVFSFTADQYRKRFRAVCQRLGLGSAYVPHSLRHGGATRWFLMGRSIDTIMHRGRWRSTKSARHYIQAGRALLVKCRLSARVMDIASRLRGRVLDIFALSQRHPRGVGGLPKVDPLRASSSSSSSVNLHRAKPSTWKHHIFDEQW